MKKETLTIGFEAEKLTALKLYLGQKEQTVEGELEKSLEILYTKTVPAVVREFLDLRSGTVVTSPQPQPKIRQAKPVSFSAVGDSARAEKGKE